MELRRKQPLCVSLLLHEDEEEIAKKKRAKRTVSLKPWPQKKVEQGIYSNLFQKLLDSKLLRDYIRIDIMQFDYLAERLYPYFIKQDTIMRESVKQSEQCCLFLRYVASEETFRSLEYQSRVSR